MLNKIIKFSLHNRAFILVAAMFLIVAGIIATRTVEVDVFPDLNAPTVVVMTEAGGMAPEEVERMVTFPIETAVGGAGNVRRVRSSSTMGFSIVWVEFDWGTPVYTARQIVSERIAMVAESLPYGVGSPTLGPQSSILGEIMFVSLTSDKASMEELRTLADRTLRPRLLTVGGVAQVAVAGGEIKEYQILPDPAKMAHYGIRLNQVLEAVGRMNNNVSGGTLYEYGQEYIIRGMVSTNNLEELGQVVVGTDNGSSILLSQIAEVQIGHKQPRMGSASIAGKDGVIMTVTKQPDVGTLELTQKLDNAIAEIRSEIPSYIEIGTDIYRQERFINSAINNVKKSLLEGGLFVIIVLSLFLMNMRSTIISVVTIPISLLATILMLQVMGFTINTMSLGGMAIAIGSLVDDAIVDVENVYKRMRENRLLPQEERKPMLKVVFEASREVRMPILNSTLIIIASFVPLFFLSGMEGRMLAPLGIAFIVALTASTLVALTLTPVLCSLLLGNVTHSGGEPKEAWTARKLKEGYSHLLTGALKGRKWVVTVTAILFVTALVMFTQLGGSFLPPFNEGSYTINVSSMPGISLDESNKIGKRVESLLLEIPEIVTVGRKTGRAELDEHALGVNTSEIEAPFMLLNRPKEELLANIRSSLKEIPGVNVEVGSPISHRIDAMLSGTSAGIAIKLFGTDLERMYTIGNQIKEEIEEIEGISDLSVEQQIQRPQLQIKPKRQMLARYGITIPEFEDIVTVLLGGEVVSQVYEGDQSFDLTLKTANDERNTKQSIEDLIIPLEGGAVPLSHIASVESKSGPNTINRENAKRKIVIQANAAGRDLVSVVQDIENRIRQKVTLPDGYYIEYGGQAESQQKAQRILIICSILSILVIFLLLYNQFHNMTQAAVILLNLPLALIGGVLAIRITSGVMSIPAIIGFISLFGIATRNGMLLMARYNDLHATGMSIRECVIQGSLDRLNPILMTALTSGLALVPLALGGDLPGNEIQSPMAIVILGGLLTSTLLNGFIIPIIYLIINRNKQ